MWPITSYTWFFETSGSILWSYQVLSKFDNSSVFETGRVISQTHTPPKKKTLKSNSHLPKKFLFICFDEGPLKMMKNAFYFILNALFVLKIFKFLSWHFGHAEETD